MPPKKNGVYADAIFRTTAHPLLVLNQELRVEAANPAFCRHFDVTAEASEGRRVYDLRNGQWDIAALHRLLEDVRASDRRVEDYRIEHDFGDLGHRVMLLNANRMRPESGGHRILVAISDVTERERLLNELRGRKEFAEKLIDSIRECLVVVDWDLRVHSANATFYEHFGVSSEETEGRRIYELGNGQWDIPELRRLLEEVLPKAKTFDDFVVEHEFPGLGHRAMLLNARRLDHINLILLAIRDVTRQRQDDHRRETLMDELQHRVKNILSNVRGLALHTGRASGSIDEFLQAFDSRLGALARAQDLIVRSDTDAIRLRDIIALELDAVGVEEGDRVTVDGPNISLPATDGRAVAMTIHELTTNAVKHGALKDEEGRIEVIWRVMPADEGEILDFVWRESGVVLTDPDPPRSFGRRVIEENIPHMIGGTASLAFNPGGAECRLEFPIGAR